MVFGQYNFLLQVALICDQLFAPVCLFDHQQSIWAVLLPLNTKGPCFFLLQLAELFLQRALMFHQLFAPVCVFDYQQNIPSTLFLRTLLLLNTEGFFFGSWGYTHTQCRKPETNVRYLRNLNSRIPCSNTKRRRSGLSIPTHAFGVWNSPPPPLIPPTHKEFV